MRRVSFAQVVTSGLVVVVLAYGLWLRTPPSGTPGVLRELSDGAPDGEARLALLEDLRAAEDQALADRDLVGAQAAALAAIALEDEPGFVTLRDGLEAQSAWPPPVTPEMALGEPYLRTLLRGWAAERDGRRGDAADWFTQSAASAVAFELTLAVRVARAGARRCQ